MAAWALTGPPRWSRPPTRSPRTPASSAGGKVAFSANSAFSNGRAPSWFRAASVCPGPATAACPDLAEQLDRGRRLGLHPRLDALEHDREPARPAQLAHHQLGGARLQGGAAQPLHRPPGLGGALDLDGHDGRGRRQGVEAEDGLGDHAEGAERPAEQLGQVVAGDVLDHLAAGVGDGAVGQDHGDADDQVADGAVAQPPRARGVGRDHPADGGPGLGRVEGQPLAGRGQGRLEVGQRHPGLGPDDQVAGGVLQHLVRARGSAPPGRPAPGGLPSPSLLPPPAKATARPSAAAAASTWLASETDRGRATNRAATPSTG